MSQPTLNLGPSLGALEVGVFVAYFLSGINAVQAFIYYQSEFHNDSRYIKLLIALVVTIEMVHSGLIGAYVYNATIDNFGNYLSLDQTPWTLALAIPIGSLAQAIVQLFFAFRVYIVLRKQIWIPLVSTILTLLHFAISIVAGVQSGRFSISEFTVRYRYLVVLALVTGAAADTINTATLVYALHRSRGQIAQSRKMIERLILWSTETGLLVTAVSFLGLILVFALPDKPAWLVVVLVFAKLYSNTMLATFNGRVALRSTGNRANISVLTMTGDNNHGLSSNPHGSPVHVQMTRQKVIMRDGQWEDPMDSVDGENPSKDAQSLSAPFASDLDIGATVIAAGDHGAKV